MIKKLEIVVVSYRRPSELLTLVNCFASQTSQDFLMRVYHDGPDAEMEALLNSLKLQYPDMFDFEISSRRFNDYGHSLRGHGISKAKSDYLLITNDDNYYVPTFVSEMITALESDHSDMVYCNMLHSHTFYKATFRTYLKKGAIDVGAIVVRTELAKKVGWQDKTFSGDGTYCEQLLQSKKDIKVRKIRKTLFVHN
jgi:hypothetical protein